MWRIIQNIPRGAFRNFGLRPVPKYREEEKDAAQKVQNARQLVCHARLSHNKAILTQILRSSDHHHNGEYQDTKGEDFRRRRTFTHDFWANVGKPCNTAEVVGWGALVIVGIQLGKLYPKHRSYGEGDRNPYCPINWIEFAIKLLQDKPSWQAARKVFSNDYSLQYDCIIKQHERKEQQAPITTHQEQRTFDTSSNSINYTASSPTRLYFEAESFIPPTFAKEIKKSQVEQTLEDHNKPILDVDEERRFEYGPSAEERPGIQQAGKEWDELTQQFTSLVLNEAGMQHAEEGLFEDAISLWNKATLKGCTKSHYNLAVCYENGRGAKKDLEQACKHYEIAAAQGHVQAQYNLALLYLEGGKGMKKDPQRALKLLESAAKNGLKQAQTELGVLYTEEERKDLERAAGLFKMAAEQKDKDGIFYLGICYENGWGVPQNQCKAADLYRQAAKEGHSTAQYNLAAFFENGVGGLPQDKKTAADMYEKAALLGERGAEDEAKRLRKEIHRLELEEHFRWQFDGGTQSLTQSHSSPVLHPSQPSLAQYLQKHLPEFGFGDLKMDSDAGSSESSGSVDEDTSSLKSNSSSSGSFKITFQLGADEFEDLSDSRSKFWYDNEDSLAVGQCDGDYLSSINLQQRSLSMIELQAVHTVGRSSHQLRVS